MRRTQSMRPQVEGLEALVFLSAVPTGPAAVARAALAQQQAAVAARPAVDLSNLDLSGTVRGNYRLQLAPDGSSGTFQLQGIGSIQGLGPARISAHYTADASSAPETITMTVTSRRGSLTLHVGRAPGDVDPDEATARLRYQVVAGTGGVTGAGGSGVLDMTLRPQVRTLGVTGQMAITLRPEAA